MAAKETPVERNEGTDESVKKTAPGFDSKLAILGVAVLLLIGAAFLYFKNGEGNTVAPPTDPLELPSTKLLLGAFEKGAALETYNLAYTANENSAKTAYRMINGGNASWVSVEGDFGMLQGFFQKGENNTSITTMCLTYENETLCALEKNVTGAPEIAASLKVLFPEKETYRAQKSNIGKLVALGAITMDSQVSEAKVGQFETQLVTYSLDYKKMTVRQLQELGMSPDDPVITAVTDQRVSFWIDRKTGLAVKSRATYLENGAPRGYETEYSKFETSAGEMPAVPEEVESATSFVRFYQNAEKDYTEKTACYSQPASEQDSCFKSVGASKKRWEICKLIKDKGTYESCTLIVAQGTNNHVLCSKLETLADDCYIAVVSETGNYELCKNLKNTSLGESCNAAAVDGLKKMQEKNDALRRLVERKHCDLDADCKITGSVWQYCVAKNNTGPFANTSSTIFACLKDVPCGCTKGLCEFKKTDEYYACVNRVENAELEDYINKLVEDSKKNQTNSTNSSG